MAGSNNKCASRREGREHVIAAKMRHESYLASHAAFQRNLAGNGCAPWQRLRQRAIERFADLGFPTLKDEDWRFTNLAPLAAVGFELAGPEQALAGSKHAVDLAGICLEFVGGQRPVLRSGAAALTNGVVVSSLADAVLRHRDLVETHLARYADYEKQPFTALNTAFLRDGVFVYLPRGAMVEQPIHLRFVGGAVDKPLAYHRRCLVVAEAGAHARIVESYEGTAGTYFTNGVTEFALGEDTVLEYTRLQKEGPAAFHVATVQVRQDRGSRFSAFSLSDGAALARTDLNVVLDAEACECTLNGLYLASAEQLVDNHTRIDHARPHCTSHELYKGILSGRAHGVFNGKIYVHPDAQKTDARQTNKTLLLSDEAVIDTKPQLEIYADDVKCTHGASIGQLDDEAIFYLRSRGIGRAAARRLLTYAFANEVIERVGIEPLRARLERALRERPVEQPAGEAP
jgi:Fe-S cluster assembly protein SufD